MDNVELVPESLKLPPTSRTNWAANIVYSTPVLHEVSSISELRSLLQSSNPHQQLATAGTGHSFNFIADSLHTRLSLRRLHQVLELDATAKTVTVAAGIKYEQLCEFLHSQGFALRNLASLTELSVAGALSTAAHGSGDANGCLATAVVGVEVAKSDGEILQVGESFGLGLI